MKYTPPPNSRSPKNCKTPQTRHIERHTPHVSLHRMSKLLETHPQPNTSFPMGSVLPLSQHTHCTSKLSVSACRSKPLRIHPPACRNSWRHTHPHKHPFQWGVLQRIKPSIWHRHHGPITSYYAPQVEMLCKRTHTYLPTDSCYAIRCTGLPPPNSHKHTSI